MPKIDNLLDTIHQNPQATTQAADTIQNWIRNALTVN